MIRKKKLLPARVPAVRLSLIFAALAIAIATPTSAAWAGITLSQDFDSGSLNVAGSTVAGTTVNLQPKRISSMEWTGNHWWVSFQATGVSGLTPQFNLDISDSFQSTASYTYNGLRFVYSYDQVNWSFFNNGSTAGSTYSFSNNAAFTQNSVWIAYGLPYTTAMAGAHTASIASSPYVLPTASGSAALVVGQTLGTGGGGYTDNIGRIVPAQNLYGYHITDPAVTGVKEKIVLIAGNHSGETTGNYVLQGAVDFLLGADPDAVALRKRADIYVYPMTDPEGRWAGYYRSDPQNPAKNHNRYWDNTTGFSDLTALETAMKADTGGNIDYFIDFHSFGASSGLGPAGVAYYDNFTANAGTTTLMNAAKSLEPGLADLGTAYGDGPGLSNAWAASTSGLGARVSVCFETSFLANQQAGRYYTIGSNYVRSLLTAVNADPPPPAPRGEQTFLTRVHSAGPAMHLRLGDAGSGSGTVAADATAHHAGAYRGGVTLGHSGAFNVGADTAAHFDGVNDYVEVPDFTYANAQKEFTLAFWFSTDDL
ncbi:MAG: M14-type cytosolic carboxypeptidase, partial [Phycisphaerae bacterium]|nr:M14-type cytosolic carboxypeptidase [Phycisphaerae bacterium]